MISLNSEKKSAISGGKNPFKYIAVAIIKTVEYGFDEWIRKRQKKYDKFYSEHPEYDPSLSRTGEQ